MCYTWWWNRFWDRRDIFSWHLNDGTFFPLYVPIGHNIIQERGSKISCIPKIDFASQVNLYRKYISRPRYTENRFRVPGIDFDIPGTRNQFLVYLERDTENLFRVPGIPKIDFLISHPRCTKNRFHVPGLTLPTVDFASQTVLKKYKISNAAGVRKIEVLRCFSSQKKHIFINFWSRYTENRDIWSFASVTAWQNLVWRWIRYQLRTP